MYYRSVRSRKESNVKKTRVKNQIIITSLVVMIAVSGYISFQISDKKASSNAMSNQIETVKNDGKKKDSKSELQDMEDAGEAVITSGKAITDFVATAKLNREQTRAKEKEELNKIIENKSLSEKARQNASEALVELTKYQDAENAIETLLGAKGFSNAVVSINKESVDVIVDSGNLSEQDLAKIQEVITRKYKVEANKIVITPMRVQ